MKRESNFYLWMAILNLTAIIGVAVTWLFIQNPNEPGEIVLRCAFYVFALLAMTWNLNNWSKYRLLENDERRDSKS